MFCLIHSQYSFNASFGALQLGTLQRGTIQKNDDQTEMVELRICYKVEVSGSNLLRF